ncbi:MAG TPA: diacylglycerol kinase family protein [Terriglobia bacterium]|nr:diacylglycerol kinase family protein [Terriglobia bacterium]
MLQPASRSGRRRLAESSGNLPLKKAIFISNPLAGIKRSRRTRQIQEAIAALRKAGIGADLLFTSCPGDAQQLATKAVKRGCDLVIVCGGDGTINEVANGMATAQIPLAVLPGGTANIIAKELRVPGNVVNAARELHSWRPCNIPLGRATWQESGSLRQRYFVAVAGVGFDACIISQLNVALKLRVGIFAYCWEAIRQAARYSFPSFRCTVNGSTVSATFLVVQRSSRYAGWLKLTGPNSIRGAGLACCLFEGSTPFRYFQYALGILSRTHHWLGDVRCLSASSVRCATERSDDCIFFELDGELAGRAPVTFDVVPDALMLLAPESFLRLASSSVPHSA